GIISENNGVPGTHQPETSSLPRSPAPSLGQAAPPIPAASKQFAHVNFSETAQPDASLRRVMAHGMALIIHVALVLLAIAPYQGGRHAVADQTYSVQNVTPLQMPPPPKSSTHDPKLEALTRHMERIIKELHIPEADPVPSIKLPSEPGDPAGIEVNFLW